jgi:hypothetical protein
VSHDPDEISAPLKSTVLSATPGIRLLCIAFHKADQCARLAKDAIEPHKRSDFENERKLWLQIAQQIEMDEVRWFRPEPM